MIRVAAPYISPGVLTPQRFLIAPGDGFISATKWQKMLDAAEGETLEIPGGRYRLDGEFRIHANTKINQHPQALQDFGSVTSPHVCYTIAPTSTPYLGAARLLSTTAYALGAAAAWAPDTAYVLDDRRCIGGIAFRCLSPHTSNTPGPGETWQQAFYVDYLAGKWERTNLQTAADISDIAAGSWLSVQSGTDRFDTRGVFCMKGETVRVRGIEGSQVILEDMLHFDYTTASGSKFYKLETVPGVEIKGGRFIGPQGDDSDRTILFDCYQTENMVFDKVEASHFFVSFAGRDLIGFSSRSCYFHDNHWLSYGFALADGCRKTKIRDLRTHKVRHAVTTSNSPNRPPIMWFDLDGFDVECSGRFLPDNQLPTAPFGSQGDAIDSHPGCFYMRIANGIVRGSSGASVHFEGSGVVVENVTADGCADGVTVVNNTTVPSRVEIDFTGYNILNRGVAVRSLNNYSPIVDLIVKAHIVDCGGTCVYVAGDSANRMRNVEIDIKTSGSKSGVYQNLVSYVDNPSIKMMAETTLGTQFGLGVFNCVNPNIDVEGFAQPSGATGTAVLISNANNSATALGRVNTGNGTLTLADPAVNPDTPEGLYLVQFTTATNFTFLDTAGAPAGTGTVGVPFAGYVNFTVNQGGVLFAAGDGFQITVVDLEADVLASGKNTGDATIAVVANTNVGDSNPEGWYIITCNSIAGGAGNETWAVVDPTGASVGTATTGVAFNTAGVQFTITAGGTAVAVGDRFRFVGTRMGAGGTTRMSSVFAPGHSTNRGVFIGNNNKNHTIEMLWDVAQTATPITLGTGGGHRVIERPNAEVRTDTTNWTYSLWTNAPIIQETAALGADRTVTLPTLNVPSGKKITLVHDGSGANWLLGAVVTIAPGEWATIVAISTAGTVSWMIESHA